MMKNILLAAAVIIILITAYYFLIYKPGLVKDTEGKPCKSGGLPGIMKSGKCIVATPTQETLPCGGRLNPC